MSPTDPAPSNDAVPVADGEYLLRRFPNEPDQFDFNQRLPRLNIFLPSKRDRDGLSLNREGGAFVTAERLLDLATSANVRTHGGVIAVLAGAARGDGMTVTPSPADTPGHVIIPEINRTDYDRKEVDGSQPGKQKIKELADKLVRKSVVRIMPKPKGPATGTP